MLNKNLSIAEKVVKLWIRWILKIKEGLLDIYYLNQIHPMLQTRIKWKFLIKSKGNLNVKWVQLIIRRDINFCSKILLIFLIDKLT